MLARIGAALVVSSVLLTAWTLRCILRVDRVAETVDAKIMRIIAELKKMTLTATGTYREDGKIQTVTVVTDLKEDDDGNPTETVEEWKARHATRIAFAETVHPDIQWK